MFCLLCDFSFTWTASRLDLNVVTLLTGNAVETFDMLFRELYFTSRAVNLSKLKLDEEPELEPVRQVVPESIVSAEMARKLYSAKYTLVNSASLKSNGTHSSMNKSGNTTPLPMFIQLRQLRMLAEEPRIHPGLVDMEKANMTNYLPTWPEPDPPSDVIGIINIRDPNKPFQAHLMRSELFETSQAIRFKEPFEMPVEHLPEKATPRHRLENADVLASMKTDQLPVQTLKNKGEEARNAPLSPQHGQESVLTPPIGNPGMVHLGVINQCDSHTTGVKGIEEPQVDSEVSASKCSSFKATNAESTKHANVCERAETSVFPQGPKDLCSAPDCSAASEHPCSTASSRPRRGTECTVSDAEKVRAMDTGIDRIVAKSSVNDSLVQSAKDPSTSDKHFQCNGNVPDNSKSPINVNGLHTHSGNPHGTNVATEGQHPTVPGSQQTLDKKPIQSTKTTMTNGESCQPDNNHRVLKEGKASIDTKKVGAQPINQQPSQEEIMEGVNRDSRPQLVQQDLGSQRQKAAMQLSCSKLKEKTEVTEVTADNKIPTSSTKEGKDIRQNTHWIPEEALFISEGDDDQKEKNLAVQNKPRGLFKKPEQAAVQGTRDKLSNSSPMSRRGQPPKMDGKHAGLSNGKVEPATHPTPKGEAEKQVEKKGYQQLSHGLGNGKSHYRSSQDISKQLKIESKVGVRLQERNPQEQARTKMESDGKKVIYAVLSYVFTLS